MTDYKIFLIISVLIIILNESLADPSGKEGEPSKKNRELYDEVAKPQFESGNKITIVGAGKVGSAVAFSLITQFVTDEIVLIDRNDKLAKGEVEDLQHGSGLIKSPRIYGGSDYKLSKNSRICIVTAGLNQKAGQSRLDLLQANLEAFKDIIPKLVQQSPNAVIIIVSNPVDIMTYITWILLNKQNTYKIIGSGTNLDSSRLRFLISQDLNISPESVNGWVIGEHGDSSVTAWSGINVAGVNLRSILHRDKDLANKMKTDEQGGDWFGKIHKQMQRSAYDIIELKGYTSWAVGLSVANIAYSILHNVHNIHAVSTMVKGQHGIEDEVFLSLPCVLGEEGVTHIIKQPLEEEELKQLKESAGKMLEVIKDLKWGDKKEHQDMGISRKI